ncbi:hypothetical protein [Clostridium nigeriense]|uniref:hypothetical protein n=1 Tax=Clostridium nigeriense TaxID=1805470 RepID=UPI000836FC85|nr:hypothetical protein [Clostridium nigeriense]
MKKFLLVLDDENILKRLKKIRVSDQAIKSYKECTVNNKNISDELARKKIKRDFVLGCSQNKYFRKYGHLVLHVNKYKIINVFPHFTNRKCTIDEEMKKRLNKILKIE